MTLKHNTSNKQVYRVILDNIVLYVLYTTCRKRKELISFYEKCKEIRKELFTTLFTPILSIKNRAYSHFMYSIKIELTTSNKL